MVRYARSGYSRRFVRGARGGRRAVVSKAATSSKALTNWQRFKNAAIAAAGAAAVVIPMALLRQRFVNGHWGDGWAVAREVAAAGYAAGRALAARAVYAAGAARRQVAGIGQVVDQSGIRGYRPWGRGSRSRSIGVGTDGDYASKYVQAGSGFIRPRRRSTGTSAYSVG